MVTRLTYTLDCLDAESLSTFWSEALGYSCRGQFGQYWPLESRTSVDEPWFVLQQVSEPKSGKNRMHVDIHVADLDQEICRLEAIGAQRVSDAAVARRSGWRRRDWGWVLSVLRMARRTRPPPRSFRIAA